MKTDFTPITDMIREDIPDELGALAAFVAPYNKRIEELKDEAKKQTNENGTIVGTVFETVVFPQDFNMIDQDKLRLILQACRINGKKIENLENFIDNNLRTNKPRIVCKTKAIKANQKKGK